MDAPESPARLLELYPGHMDQYSPLWGIAVDIGTTTVTLWLVDLVSGKVKAQVAEYNGQIARGEDVISRIIYADKDGGRQEMRHRVLDTINGLLELLASVSKVEPHDVLKATVAGNSTMMHLLSGHTRRQHPTLALHHCGQSSAAPDCPRRWPQRPS